MVEYIGDEEQPHAGGSLRGKIECRGIFPRKKGATKKAENSAAAAAAPSTSTPTGTSGPVPTILLGTPTAPPPRDIRDYMRPPDRKLTR